MAIRLALLAALIAAIAILSLGEERKVPPPQPQPAAHSVPTVQTASAEQLRRVAEAVEQALDRLPSGSASEAVITPIPAQPVATGGADDDWRPTNCKHKRILWRLVRSPNEDLLRCIFGAIDLNPRETPVTKDRQETVVRTLAAYLKSSSELEDTAFSAAMDEFKQLVKLDGPGLPHITKERYLELAKVRAPEMYKRGITEDGFDPDLVPFAPRLAFEFEAALFRPGRDGFFGSRVVDMPSAKPAYEAMAFVNLEIATSAIRFAEAYGTITPEEAKQLLKEAEAAFEQMLD